MPVSSTAPAPSTAPGLGLLLHAHLPAVPADEPGAPESRWFFRVLAESYLPLLKRLRGLAREGVDFRVAMHWSPVVRAALGDARVRRGFVTWLENAIEGARGDARRPWVDALKTFTHDWKEDVPAQWEALATSGHVEQVAGSATHAFLPLLANQPEFLRAQIRLGRAETPGAEGFWLPEAACAPEVAAALLENRLRWTVVDDAASGPSMTPDGLVVFPVARALAAATGNPREFLAALSHTSGFPVVPLEIETLGHDRRDGIDFLEAVLRNADTRSPGDFLAGCPRLPLRPIGALTPADGDTFAETWLNERTAWLYPEMAETARVWQASALAARTELPRVSCALAQSAREFLLCQYSDWPLMVTADPDGLGQVAEARLREHLRAARELASQARGGNVSEHFLAARESARIVFPNLDWRLLRVAG